MNGVAAGRADASAGSPADDDWETPPRAAPPTDAPILSAGGFEGPLDWLLEMARAQKIDLAKLPIAALIQSFAAALDVALARPNGRAPVLARWGDWLVMAATLTQLRSRLLLPPDAPEAKAAAAEAEALRRQLLGRAQLRAAADWLERRPQLGRDLFTRGRSAARAGSRAADITDLLRACLVQLRVPAAVVAAYRPRPPPFWRVPQAIARITTLLREQPAGAALPAFLPPVALESVDRDMRCRAAVASTFLAGLELARGGAIGLEQAVAWGEISVTPTGREPAAIEHGASA